MTVAVTNEKVEKEQLGQQQVRWIQMKSSEFIQNQMQNV